jgi:hypothetical protein
MMTVVSFGAVLVLLPRTYQVQLVGLCEIVIIFIEICAQGSVIHPRRDYGRYWAKTIGNPVQWKNAIMLQLLPLGEVIHQPLEMTSYH